MRTLHIFDKGNYPTEQPVLRREAARAIIWQENRLLLIRSQKYGEYKFPGGGVKKGEKAEEAALREAREEAGCLLLPQSLRPFGQTIERMRDSLDSNYIFEQISYYFFAEASEETTETHMDDYEIEYGYQARLTPLSEAIARNRELLQSGRAHPSWVQRELFVMELLQAQQEK